MKQLYDMMFKRKSMRKFDDTLSISKEELNQIELIFSEIKSIDPEIAVRFEIVPKSETSCKRGEYCILMYSEKKPHYLLNVGYMLEQVDLILASYNIGACWYGFGKTEEKQEDELDFIIMLSIGKSQSKDFRKDVTKCKRKKSETIWKGDFNQDIVEVVRYAPSACNMQPWYVTSENNTLKVYRTKEVSAIMPKKKRPFYNSIDIGIFLCFLEILLDHHQYKFQRTLHEDRGLEEKKIQMATYKILIN